MALALLARTFHSGGMDLPARLEVERSTAQRSCPFCHDVLRAEDAVWECPRCRTLHHTECASTHGHCSVFACAGELLSGPEPPLDLEGAQFVTASEDHSEITRLRTPELVWASFFVKALAGLWFASYEAVHLRQDVLNLLDGSIFPMLFGVGFALSPIWDLLRIRERGYEARASHKAYVVSLAAAMAALLVLCGVSSIAADAYPWLGFTALLVFVVDACWPAARG